MKRFLSVFLTLCLLCAVPVSLAEVDYESDYETALTLARNDLTNRGNVETAVDMLQHLGSYRLAMSYTQYLQAVLDLFGDETDLALIRVWVEFSGRSETFVTDLAERGFPACEDIIAYIDARMLEASGEDYAALEAYAAMTVLDSPIRMQRILTRMATAETKVDVRYVTEDGAQLAGSIEDVPRGSQMTFRAKEYEGYVLTADSPESVTVTVDAMGRMSAREVIFTYRSLPDTAAVTVVYRTADGIELGRETADVERGGSQPVEAKAFDGYVLMEGAAGTVQVFADNLGNLSQDEVVFTYKALPAYAEVTVVCQDENGAQLKTQTIRVDRGSSGTFMAETIDGYELTSASSAVVTVDAKGNPDKTQVVFKYQAIKPKVSVGSYVTFGHYPQTAAGDDNTPIEWLVLEVQDGKVLLISRYGLDTKPYSEEYDNITWEECTLRIWLNDEFMNRAFTAQEQEEILQTDVDNSRWQRYNGSSVSGDRNTWDKVFLLSYAEADTYFGVEPGSGSNIKSRVAPTDYAKQRGASTSNSNKTVDGLGAGWWWLRSRIGNREAAFVLTSGSLFSSEVILDGAVVRPALWLNQDADIF